MSKSVEYLCIIVSIDWLSVFGLAAVCRRISGPELNGLLLLLLLLLLSRVVRCTDSLSLLRQTLTAHHRRTVLQTKEEAYITSSVVSRRAAAAVRCWAKPRSTSDIGLHQRRSIVGRATADLWYDCHVQSRRVSHRRDVDTWRRPGRHQAGFSAWRVQHNAHHTPFTNKKV